MQILTTSTSLLPYKNIGKHIGNAIRHFKKKKNELEAHHTKASLINFRNNIIANQKRHNYNNEYQRLIWVLSNKTITHSGNRDQLENRVKQLEKLGARATTGLSNKKQTYEQIVNEIDEDFLVTSTSVQYKALK